MLAVVETRSVRSATICLAAVVFFASAVAVAEVADTPPARAEAVKLQLKHAETYYWFGMAEQGNMAAFRKGLRHLDRAARLVDQGDFSDVEKRLFSARIDGLQTDLNEQIEIAHDTLYGLFPLTRFLTESIFAESTSLDTFEVIDDPTVMASTFAAKKLALETIKHWTQRHQLDVVFTSVPRNPQLENEALYVFNTHPKFFVHNLREVIDALDERQLAEFQAGRVTPEIRDALLAAFGVSDVLVVLVREVDVVDGDYFYLLEGEIHQAEGQAPSHDFAVMGFSRDRNAQFFAIIFANLFFLALAYAAFWLQTKWRRRAAVRASVGTFLVLPLLAFLVGRCTPFFLGPLLKSIAPIPETLAIVSFWVPCVAGAALTVAPMTAFWLVSKRLAKIWPVFDIDARVAAVFVGIGAGAAAYLSVSLFLFMEGAALQVLVPLTIGIVGVSYLFGRALDSVDRLSMTLAFVPLALSLLLGAAAFQCLSSWAWAAAALTVVACAVPAVLDIRRRSEPAAAPSAGTTPAVEPQRGAAAASAIDMGRLDERIENPVYQEFAKYTQYRKLVEPLRDGRTVHAGFHGAAGCGLSATAAAVVNDLAAALRERGGDATLMHGECSSAVGELTPYGPFRKALAQHFEIELLAAPESKLAEIDAALGDVFQSVLPFAGVLFPATGGEAACATSGEQIVSSIAWMFRRLSKTKSVILLIDDVQWLDESSKGLLKHLLREFRPGGPEPIAIIVASHDPAIFDDLGIAVSEQAEIPFPSLDQQKQILTSGIGLTEDAAEQLVARVGPSTVQQGGLFWLLQVTANVARAGALVPTDQGLALRDGTWPQDVVVPDELRDILVEQLDRFPKYRMIMECSACACAAREFRGSHVADALGRARLDLLADLDRIDRETSIIYDVRERDDVFAFQSSFMLEAVRQELRIVECGPTSGEVPQLIREYHAQLGAVLEASLQANSNQIYAVANHYYAAGARYADRGARHCLQAAQASSAVLDFDAAAHYLRRAAECAEVSGQAGAVAAVQLEIECRQAHLTGQSEDHRRVAEAGAEYLRRHSDCPAKLLLAIGQIHYDAGKSSGDREWFERSLQIGQRMIDSAQSARDEAVGRHFVGISLPPAQHDERRRQLREALRLVETEKGETQDFELMGRIMGSLAEELTRGSAEDRREARELFERRLRLNETQQVGDPRGQAMTHGGLGRLAFFHEPRDLATAAYHFQKDLEISEAIGDQQGLIQMHSLLGACALEEDDVEQALHHYERSWELSQHATSQFFAGTGLIACYGRTKDRRSFQQVVDRLLALADDGVPSGCAEDLAAALTACPPEWLQSGADRLLAKTQTAGDADSRA